MHADHGDDDRRITYFATTHTRGKRDMFGIRAVDRGKHVYVIGKTGMGKSTMLENMAIQDIQNGEGIAFIDPHGSTAEKLLDFIPEDRIKDVVYFAPFDTDHPMGFNVMEDVGYDKRHLVVSGLMGALKRIWVDAWSARMEYILQNALLALLEYPDSSLLDVNKMLINKKFREDVVQKVSDPIVLSFWRDEFAGFSDNYAKEATAAIQNKIGQFTSNPLIRNIVGQAHSSFDLREIMDQRKIFIVNLSKGRMGETNAALLGSMLTVKIYLAAMSRADEPAARMAKLPRFYFYVDEFQSMMNEAFADILSESRKYKLALTLANQYIEQMEEEVRDAVFGNVGTLIVFRVGPFDAEVLETVFDPTFTPEDLVNLGVGQIYLTLMIDGVGSAPFSAETIPPIEAPSITYRNDVIESSRASYGRVRAHIEAMINKKQQEFAMPPPEKKPRKYEGGQGDAPRRFDAPPRDQGKEPRTVILQNITNQSHTEFNTTRVNVPAPVPRLVAPAPAPHHTNAARSPNGRAEADRSTLRDAIEKARKEGLGGAGAPPSRTSSEVPRESVRTPAEMLREKRGHKPPSAEKKPEQHAESSERKGEWAAPPRPEKAAPPKEDHEHRTHGGEVSHRVLMDVLNGDRRDHDDL